MNGFHSFAALNISKIRSILDIFFVLLYGLRRRASPFCLRFAPAVPTETIHQQLYFILPPAAVAATPAGYCGSLQSKLQALSYPPKKKPASCKHCLIPRRKSHAGFFFCPQRGLSSLNLVLSLKPTFNIVLSLRGARCNYPLTCFAGHYHFIKRLCRRHCVPLTLSKAGSAPAVPTETIHQQLYFILPPAAVAATPAGYCGTPCRCLHSKHHTLSYPP